MNIMSPFIETVQISRCRIIQYGSYHIILNTLVTYVPIARSSLWEKLLVLTGATLLHQFNFPVFVNIIFIQILLESITAYLLQLLWWLCAKLLKRLLTFLLRQIMVEQGTDKLWLWVAYKWNYLMGAFWLDKWLFTRCSP